MPVHAFSNTGVFKVVESLLSSRLGMLREIGAAKTKGTRQVAVKAAHFIMKAALEQDGLARVDASKEFDGDNRNFESVSYVTGVFICYSLSGEFPYQPLDRARLVEGWEW